MYWFAISRLRLTVHTRMAKKNRRTFSRLYVGEVLQIWYQSILPKERKLLSAVKCRAESGRTMTETIASLGRLWQTALIFAAASRTIPTITIRNNYQPQNIYLTNENQTCSTIPSQEILYIESDVHYRCQDKYYTNTKDQKNNIKYYVNKNIHKKEYFNPDVSIKNIGLYKKHRLAIAYFLIDIANDYCNSLSFTHKFLTDAVHRLLLKIKRMKHRYNSLYLCKL